MEDLKEDYIKYRIQKARQTLHDAEILITQESWNSAVNRLYYTCFHCVQALLLKYDISTKTHSGAKTKFFQEFIHKNLIDKEFSKLYSDLSDWRQESDYADFREFDKETVSPLPEKVRAFIDAVEKLL